MKVKEYVDFDHYERDPHRQDVDLICIVGKPNGYVCADLITDCRRWQTRSVASSTSSAATLGLRAGTPPSTKRC